jgi:hypothetical protein
VPSACIDKLLKKGIHKVFDGIFVAASGRSNPASNCVFLRHLREISKKQKNLAAHDLYLRVLK